MLTWVYRSRMPPRLCATLGYPELVSAGPHGVSLWPSVSVGPAWLENTCCRTTDICRANPPWVDELTCAWVERLCWKVEGVVHPVFLSRFSHWTEARSTTFFSTDLKNEILIFSSKRNNIFSELKVSKNRLAKICEKMTKTPCSMQYVQCCTCKYVVFRSKKKLTI